LIYFNVVAFIQEGMYLMFQPSLARQRLAKTHSLVNKDSAKVSVDMRNLGIARHFRYNGYRRRTYGYVAEAQSILLRAMGLDGRGSIPVKGKT
jgi:hypothetical protein